MISLYRSREHTGRSLSRRLAGWRTVWIGPALVLSLALLVLGLRLPAFAVETIPFLSDSVSILEGVGILWRQEEYLLFAVLFVFSVLFPSAKLLVALWAWYGADGGGPGLTRLLGLIERLGKWSMLDVLVVALAVVGINLSFVSSVFVDWGIYCFTGSVVLAMLTIGRIRRLAAKGGASD